MSVVGLATLLGATAFVLPPPAACPRRAAVRMDAAEDEAQRVAQEIEAARERFSGDPKGELLSLTPEIKAILAENNLK